MTSTEWVSACAVAAGALSAACALVAPRGVASYLGVASRALLGASVALLALALALSPF